MEAAKEMNDKKIVFSSNAKVEIKVFSDLTKEIVKNTVNVFVSADTALARSIEPLEEVADHLNSEIKKR
jgi:phosphate:Na+ symporter